jgi:hypothetical protein
MSLVPEKKPLRSTFEQLKSLHPRVQLRLALAGGGALLAVVLFATCGGCGKRPPAGGDTTAAHAAGDGGDTPASKAAFVQDGAALRDQRMWGHAKDGEEEDLSTLAAHEGPIGLVEAASDPPLRTTAIKAMAYARGWAQLPFLAKVAGGKDDEEARLALDTTVELAARPRKAEDPEDAEELAEGCEALSALARDAKRPRTRRVSAIRALRMMPCPPPKEGEALPTDVDTK